jgi:hypothetical protein
VLAFRQGQLANALILYANAIVDLNILLAIKIIVYTCIILQPKVDICNNDCQQSTNFIENIRLPDAPSQVALSVSGRFPSFLNGKPRVHV